MLRFIYAYIISILYISMLRKNSGSRRCLFPPIQSHALEIHCSRRFADKTLAGTSSSQDRGTCQCLVKLEMSWAGI